MASVEDLRSALACSRERAGVQWSPAEWERVWAALTARQRSVVFLHLIEGHTHTEVAELLGLGRGAVDGAWRRALERIRGALPAP